LFSLLGKGVGETLSRQGANAASYINKQLLSSFSTYTVCSSHFRWQKYLETLLDCGAPPLSPPNIPFQRRSADNSHAQPHSACFGSFMRQLAVAGVALAATFLNGAEQRESQITIKERSSAYFLSRLPYTFFQVFRVLSFRSSEYFLSGLFK
jgi:hypothetical protein